MDKAPTCCQEMARGCGGCIVHLVTLLSESHHRTQSGTGMLPSAMPAASISSSVAKRYKPSYRAQSALSSALVQVSNNCLNGPIWSASDSRRASSPPPLASICVTCVSIITASWVCSVVNGIGLYLLTRREGLLTTWPIMTQVTARERMGARHSVPTPFLRPLSKVLAKPAAQAYRTNLASDSDTY